MIPWWAVIIGIVIIVTVIMTVRGWAIARRCRNLVEKSKKTDKVVEPTTDEDFEAGDADAK